MTKTIDIEVTDDNQEELLASLVGLKIISATRERNSGASFPQGANGITLELEGGTILVFGSWGYDADGTTFWIQRNEYDTT